MSFNREKYVMNNNIFLDFKLFSIDENKLTTYKIPIEFSGRPDLISYSLYNDVSYQYYLAYLNSIEDSPEGFYTDRVIKVLKREYIQTI